MQLNNKERDFLRRALKDDDIYWVPPRERLAVMAAGGLLTFKTDDEDVTHIEVLDPAQAVL
jgi:hypothetical protein